MGKRIQKLMLKDLAKKTLYLGYASENIHTQIVIDCSEVFWDYPNATYSMNIQPPRGDKYPAAQLAKDGDALVWTVTDSDLIYHGSGHIQLEFKNGDEVIKSAVGTTKIDGSIETTGDVPTPLEDWMDQAEETAHQIALTAKDEVIEQIQDAAEEARESIPADYTQLSDDVSELKSAFEQLEANVITDSAGPAPIVSIADGADGMPMRSVEVAIEPVQEGEGDPSPDNVRPITGWTRAKVTRTGKNLFDEVYTNIRVGSIVTYKPVFVGSGIFTLSSTAPNSGSGNSLFLLSGNVGTGASSGTNGVYAGRPITMPSVDGYVTIGYRNYQDIDPREYKSQLEVGSVATNYESYQGQTYEVTFPAEAGTVYGGMLDVVSGKLVVDRAVKDMGSATWKYNPSSGLFYYTQSNIKTGVPVTDELDLLICSCYATTDKPGSGRVLDGMIGTGSAGHLSNTSIIVNDSRYDDPDAFKETVTGQTICYKLANPTEITLTPTEIKTLLGTNNIWSDAGNTSITYPADTKTYIDNRINSTRRLIAGIETGFTASKAYAVGDMLIIGDDLYKVASAIASGATITVGTNVNKTTVAEQLIALANA